MDEPAEPGLRSRPELLGEVPYLLGYHPADSVVAVFLTDESIILLTGRMDLSTPAAVLVEQWSQVARRYGAASVMLIGYGHRTQSSRVSAIADAVAAQVSVTDVLLVADGEYVCLRCPCREADGVPFDPAATASAARATLAGRVALPSRQELLALTEPDLLEQVSVGAALAQLPVETDDGPAVVRYLMELAADGQRLQVDEVARLVRLLHERPVRDVAWRATGKQMWQRDLWLDVTRRAPAGHVAAPASLAAWCAWQRGEETLAVAALDRALADDKTYLLARLIWHAILHGLPAHQLLKDLPDMQDTSANGEQP
ncbi:DUF4192 domain-containing protein [Actinoplanes regularis]|uniref:DUF4192 domain-containing protein n=1 Tax=Actinoplanes regularis TaxID=52697 RepID=UPI0015C66898|nr:DUF4192 domain-containing protein [Actinoplanes regularis]